MSQRLVVAVLTSACALSAAAFEPLAIEQDTHWAERLALRVAARERTAQVVEQVVLVPDAATYLDEIGHWTLDRRWPVLIEDEHLTPKFVRAFDPKRVVRRESVGALPRGDGLRTAIVRTVLVTLGSPPPTASSDGPPTSDGLMRTLDDHLGQMGDPPPGVVLIVPDDSAWTAAVAIAAARALPVRWLPGRFGRGNATLSAARLGEFVTEVNRQIDSTPWRWRTLGDDIETVLVCGDLAVRATHDRGSSTAAIATSDMLGRLPDGSRGAFGGWIDGSEARAAYVAMCSLFLPRRDALLFNSYGTGQPWVRYELATPRRLLADAGFRTTLRDGDGAGADAWQASLRGGWHHDVVFVNSSGNPEFFNVAGGQRQNAADIPVLNRPAAVQFIHSWAFRSPDRLGVVGGHLLAHGAYLVVASVEEPGLSAFFPPSASVRRMLAGVPFHVAMRWWPPEALSQPWRVATFGDPLMTVVPPDADPRRRVAPSDDFGRGTDLRTTARRLMADANANRCAETATEAIRALRLLAEDRIAAEFHRAAATGGFANADAAVAALPSYFVLGDHAGFVEAWQYAGTQGFPYTDMAWHLLFPRIAADRTIALTLEEALRSPRPDDDAIRLYRRMIEAIGRDEARAFLQRAIDRMPNQRQADRLRGELNRR